MILPSPLKGNLSTAFGVLGQLNNQAATRKLHLLGQPQIFLLDNAKIHRCLAQEFLLEDLELLSRHLWMMAKQDAESILSTVRS